MNKLLQPCEHASNDGRTFYRFSLTGVQWLKSRQCAKKPNLHVCVLQQEMRAEPRDEVRRVDSTAALQ